MPDDDWLDSELMRQVVDDLSGDIVDRYRISWPDAEQMVCESFGGNTELMRAAAAATSAARLKRTRVFKQAATVVKRGVYYRLRSYRGDADRLADLIDTLQSLPSDAPEQERLPAIDAILRAHASTRERLACGSEFYRHLFAVVPPPRHVLDIGCGVHPLMFPFGDAWSRQIVQYLAVDSSPHDIACLEAARRLPHGEGRLDTCAWNISDGWSCLQDQSRCAEFDLALMMKLVPVIHRQHRDLLPVLCQAPARLWLLTGSRVSLTRHVSIERRERRVLEEFVKLAGREVTQEFVVEEEFAWLVARP
jgi:hypothetical protein